MPSAKGLERLAVGHKEVELHVAVKPHRLQERSARVLQR
jgi:hypothetical protein